MIENLSTATPAEIDAELADLDGAFHKLSAKLASIELTLHRANGEQKVRVGRGQVYTTDIDQTLTELAAKIAADTRDYRLLDAGTYMSRRLDLLCDIAANRAEADRLDAEYLRRPWARYIGVSGGHIHSGYQCAGGTIRPTTLREWRPALSGKSIAEAIAELQTTMCTHCFPGAPVVEAPKASRCPGSGKTYRAGTCDMRRASRYGICPDCGTTQSVTSLGSIRAHRPA